MRERVHVLVLAVVLVVPLSAWAAERWPPLVPPRSTLSPALAADIERLWTRPTFTRHIEGERAQAPFDLYVALIDAPEITASAGRQLQLARYEVQRLGDDRYRADDGSGARGEYLVLVRERARRVMLSRGSHTGRIVGTITGIGLTELRFEARDGQVAQRLSAWVIIDNRLAALVVRVLVPLFGQIVDRKLQEAFRVTARVAEWATSHPVEFCDWLVRQPFPAETHQPVRMAAGGCPSPPAPRR
jgi:hypothetical protein